MLTNPKIDPKLPEGADAIKGVNSYLSLYHGEFQTIGSYICESGVSLKDFNIITNVPYGN